MKSAQGAADFRWGVGLVASVFAILSLGFARWDFAKHFDDKRHWVATAQAIVLAAWVVLPPIWFWFENFFVYKDHGYPNEDWERFKYGQDQSSKIWLALVTALLAL